MLNATGTIKERMYTEEEKEKIRIAKIRKMYKIWEVEKVKLQKRLDKKNKIV